MTGWFGIALFDCRKVSVASFLGIKDKKTTPKNRMVFRVEHDTFGADNTISYDVQTNKKMWRKLLFTLYNPRYMD